MTLHDIAARTGTSVSTVSRVLSGGAQALRISDATCRKVLAAARELGYRPNLLARSLRTRRSHTVALLVSDIANPFFGAIATLIERQLHQHGYTLMLCNSQEDPEQEQEYLQLMGQKGIDGLIIVPMARTCAQLRAPLPPDLPLVVLDRPVDGHPFCVSSDEEQSANLLCQVLERAAVAKVALVSGPESIVTHRHRAAVIQRRFEVTDRVEGPPQVETGRRAFIQLLSKQPQAILCTNNFLGQGVLDAIAQIDAPPIVACFDQIPMAHLLPIPMVMMLQDIPLLADGCVRLLLAQLEAEPGGAADPIVLRTRAVTNPAFQALAARSAAGAPT